MKFAKLVDEYEGEGTGDKYVQTAKTLIDRRGTNMIERESGYWGGEYSQDNASIKEITEAVGHASTCMLLLRGRNRCCHTASGR